MAPLHIHSRRGVHSLGPAIISTQWVIISLAVLSLILRLYIRCVRRATKFGFDDVAIIIATGLSIFGGVTGTIFAKNGIGTHIWLLSPAEVEHAFKWLVIGVFQSYIALFFLRISIAIFILRMLTGTNETHRKLKLVVYFCLFLNFTATLTVLCFEGLWCRPLEGVWDKSVAAKCISNGVEDNGVRAYAAISAVTDLFYASLPIAIFWPLKMEWSVKRNLGIVMLFTLVICACAIGKAVAINETSTDFTYFNASGTFWALFEVNLGIIVANLPAIRQFYIITRDDISSLRSKNSAEPLNREARNNDQNGLQRSPMRQNLAWRLMYGGTTTQTSESKANTICVQQDISVAETDMTHSAVVPSIDEDVVWSGQPHGQATYSAYAESMTPPARHN